MQMGENASNLSSARGPWAFVATELLTFVLFVLLSVAMTWPLATHLSTAVTGPDDPYVSTSILYWDLEAALHDPAALFDLPVFYPSRNALAFTEHLFGIALALLPFHLSGASPITLHSIGILLGFAFCGYGASVLGRVVTGSHAAGIVGGMFFAFLPYRFHHLGHISYVWAGWLPLFLAAILFYARKPTWRRGVLVGATLFANGLTCLHWLAFGSVTAVLTVLFVASVTRSIFDVRWWLRLLVPVAVASLALLPFLLPYREVAQEYGMQRSWAETLPYSAQWADWATPPRENRLWGTLTPAERYVPEHPLFPGVVVLVLSAIALLFPVKQPPVEPSLSRSRLSLEIWCVLLWIATGVAGAFGWNGVFHRALFLLVSPMRGIRVPLRWSMIAYVGLAVLAAVGTARLARGSTRLRRAVVPALVSVVLLIELWPASIRWYHADPSAPAVYEWLASTRIRGGVLELPLSERFSDYNYLLGQTIHQRPLINGVSSFVPARYSALQAAAHATPMPSELVPMLEDLHCSLVIVHVDELYERRPAVREWLRAELAAGRLAFVRRFDERIFGAYVFAVRSIEPEASAWRAPEVADRSGRTPSQSLQTFLESDGFTYNETPFGYGAVPRWGEDVRGDLSVDGWALAPDGVREVRLFLNGGHDPVIAERYAAPWVTRLQGWYDEPLAGFRAVIPASEAPQRRESDLVIEIIDNRGRSRRLPDLWFRWSNQPGLQSKDWRQPELASLLERLGIGGASTGLVLDRLLTVGDLGDRLIADTQDRPDAEFVKRAYQVILAREPSAADGIAARERLAEGGFRVSLTDSLFASEEFAQRHLMPGVTMEPLR